MDVNKWHPLRRPRVAYISAEVLWPAAFLTVAVEGNVLGIKCRVMAALYPDRRYRGAPLEKI